MRCEAKCLRFFEKLNLDTMRSFGVRRVTQIEGFHIWMLF